MSEYTTADLEDGHLDGLLSLTKPTARRDDTPIAHLLQAVNHLEQAEHFLLRDADLIWIEDIQQSRDILKSIANRMLDQIDGLTIDHITEIPTRFAQ